MAVRVQTAMADQKTSTNFSQCSVTFQKIKIANRNVDHPRKRNRNKGGGEGSETNKPSRFVHRFPGVFTKDSTYIWF